ncbi:MAG: hypothetical protein JOZ90_08980 [Alphaproteobacteria bacterium]|nr:hypothetical protein [Alphaproteobacteria bacterium]MBV9371138.1 hypothetical protein [Alphaproteobacteria bacterium]MBV9901217.1 hypothetical protein [Alphaproteobacteria bacterium]
MAMTRSRWILAALAAAILAGLLALVLGRRAESLHAADGAFANDCCGDIRLDGGRMILNDKQSVHYSIGRDAKGPYILPRTYVGAFEDRGFEVDGTRPALKLRLDRLPAPGTILLFEGLRPYVFAREAAPRRHRP